MSKTTRQANLQRQRLTKLRRLKIVQLISKTPMRQTELAEALHVSERTIFRDLVALIDEGYDVWRADRPRDPCPTCGLSGSPYEEYFIEGIDSGKQTTPESTQEP